MAGAAKAVGRRGAVRATSGERLFLFMNAGPFSRNGNAGDVRYQHRGCGDEALSQIWFNVKLTNVKLNSMQQVLRMLCRGGGD